jgi:hypothetical protein
MSTTAEDRSPGQVPWSSFGTPQAQSLRAQQGGDAGDQRAGGVRLAVTELAEQVPLGADDVDAVRLSMLKDGLGELGK